MLTVSESAQTTFQRKLSPVERLFIATADTNPPFCNQMILEGTGTLDEKLWEKAVAEACEANPGSRLVYRGRSVWSKWVDSGVSAPVRVVDGTNWSGHGPEGAPFLFDPIPYKERTCEVLLVKGGQLLRVIFRTHHATMDGAGTLGWANDICRALRKEPLVGSKSMINDKELVDQLNLKGHETFRPNVYLSPTGPPQGDEPGFTWKRITVEGKFSKLLPRMAMAVAAEARKHSQGKVQFSIPLDLRRWIPEPPDSTANFTRRVLLDVPPDATIESLTHEIKEKHKNICGDPKFNGLLAYIPSAMMRSSIRWGTKKIRERKRFSDSGILSNGGILPIDDLHGGGFVTTGFFWVPPHIEAKCLFISTIGYGNNIVEFVFAMSNIFANNGRFDEFVSNIMAEFKPN